MCVSWGASGLLDVTKLCEVGGVCACCGEAWGMWSMAVGGADSASSYLLTLVFGLGLAHHRSWTSVVAGDHGRVLYLFPLGIPVARRGGIFTSYSVRRVPCIPYCRSWAGRRMFRLLYLPTQLYTLFFICKHTLSVKCVAHSTYAAHKIHGLMPRVCGFQLEVASWDVGVDIAAVPASPPLGGDRRQRQRPHPSRPERTRQNHRT